MTAPPPIASSTAAASSDTTAPPETTASAAATVPRADAASEAEQGSRTPTDRPIRDWIRSRRWWLVIGLLVVVAVSVIISVQARTSSIPFAPDNPSDAGARGIAQILGRQGVDVQFVRTHTEARAALDELAATGQPATLLIAKDFGMSDDQAAMLVGEAQSTVLFEPGRDLLTTFAPSVTPAFGTPSTEPRSAACDDPDAVAAERIAPTGAGYQSGDPQAVVCFGTIRSGAMIRLGQITVLDSAEPFANAHLREEGNAALGLRLLGQHESLVWLVPDRIVMQEVTDTQQAASTAWMDTAAATIALALGLAIWWRGRRFGPLIAEPLPVVVRTEEVTRGRARLYRRSRDTAHAAALLRAGTLSQIASRLGLPATTSREAMIEAVAIASGRSPSAIEHLCYGADPANSHELSLLSLELETLRREVRHV